jgi:hypothetical protein
MITDEGGSIIPLSFPCETALFGSSYWALALRPTQLSSCSRIVSQCLVCCSGGGGCWCAL